MAQKKKVVIHRTNVKKKIISKTQTERAFVAVRKLFEHLGCDSGLLDSFTKKQKQIILQPDTVMPRVHAEKNTVPRQYIRNIQTEVSNLMKKYFDEKLKLTYLDLVMYGIPGVLLILQYIDRFDDKQKEALTVMSDAFEKSNILNRGLDDILMEVQFMTDEYSQINFRTYGSFHKWNVCPFRLTIELTAHENKPIYFMHQNVRRMAYKILIGDSDQYESTSAAILLSTLFPHIKSKKKLSIYVQSHAIHRFKERADVIDPQYRNLLIYLAMTKAQRVVKGSGGGFLLACDLNLCVPIGYFTTMMQNDNLYVLTFLPLVANVTPEGEKLQKILSLNTEDLKFLGMDKLKFFLTVDFDQIPVLKNALIESGIWPTVEYLSENLEEMKEISQKRTMFVKDFFEKPLTT
jgi:hypothetical protein